MSKKKIVILGPAFPYRGGNSLFISHLYHSLAEKFEVTLFNYKLLYPSFLFPGTTQYDQSNTALMKAPNERIINSINPFNWIYVASRINVLKPDLIVFDWWHPFFGPCHFYISSFIQKRFKDKILFITENFVSHEGNFIDKILTRLGLSNASSFLCLSAKVEKELQELNHRKKVYRSELPVYDCYEMEKSDELRIRESMGYSPEDKILLFFGYVRKYKGLDILLKALPALVKVDPSIRILVAGEFYDEQEYYLNLVKESGHADKVKVVNKFISNEEVGNYYGISDLVILPYRSATQSGILNVAYGFLKPVLITDVGGLAEFVDEDKTGVIVNPESPDEIVRGVKKFFELKKTTDFTSYIRKRVGSNSFNSISSLFEEITESSHS